MAPIFSVREGELLPICWDWHGWEPRVSSMCCSRAACDPQILSWCLRTRAAEGGASRDCVPRKPTRSLLSGLLQQAWGPSGSLPVCFSFCPSPVAFLCTHENVSVAGRLCRSWDCLGSAWNGWDLGLGSWVFLNWRFRMSQLEVIERPLPGLCEVPWANRAGLRTASTT